MFASIHDVSGRGLEDYVTRPRHEWVLQWPGMVVLVVTAIFWTRGVEKALKVGWCRARRILPGHNKRPRTCHLSWLPLDAYSCWFGACAASTVNGAHRRARTAR